MNLCLGTAQLGMDYGVHGGKQPGYDEIDDILSYALSHDIRVFDVAPVYGEAESVIGRFIKHRHNNSEKPEIISKLPASAFDDKPVSGWRDAILSAARQDISSLGVDKLRGYLFHKAAHLYDDNAIMAMESVVKEGLADMIGVSVYTPDEALYAVKCEPLSMIQVPYNVFDCRLDRCGFFEKAKAAGKIVYVRSVLLQGLLTMSPEELPEKMAFAYDAVKGYDALCAEYNVTKLKVALGYVSDNPCISHVVFGVDSKEQLAEFVDSCNYALPDGMLDDLRNMSGNIEERIVNPTMW